jgi:hypothetical protein
LVLGAAITSIPGAAEDILDVLAAVIVLDAAFATLSLL